MNVADIPRVNGAAAQGSRCALTLGLSDFAPLRQISTSPGVFLEDLRGGFEEQVAGRPTGRVQGIVP